MFGECLVCFRQWFVFVVLDGSMGFTRAFRRISCFFMVFHLFGCYCVGFSWAFVGWRGFGGIWFVFPAFMGGYRGLIANISGFMCVS